MKNTKIDVHTRLHPETVKKLKNTYGNGKINTGIENLLKLAEQKTHDIREGITKIVSWILSEK